MPSLAMSCVWHLPLGDGATWTLAQYKGDAYARRIRVHAPAVIETMGCSWPLTKTNVASDDDALGDFLVPVMWFTTALPYMPFVVPAKAPPSGSTSSLSCLMSSGASDEYRAFCNNTSNGMTEMWSSIVSNAATAAGTSPSSSKITRFPASPPPTLFAVEPCLWPWYQYIPGMWSTGISYGKVRVSPGLTMVSRTLSWYGETWSPCVWRLVEFSAWNVLTVPISWKSSRLLIRVNAARPPFLKYTVGPGSSPL
mmetsp:Transcript_13679/g.54816  ORF Transcript_13679/g.54816 Transcript_13679/m.54816 type:complete len:253 (-) Transcript_13679:289-1047(-)